MPDDARERTNENELNRLWNDLLQDGLDLDGYSLSTDDADTVINLHTHGKSPLHGPARERAWYETLSRIEIARHQEEESMNLLGLSPLVAAEASANGRITVPNAAPYPGAEERRRVRHWGHIAVAAAILLLIAAGMSGYLLLERGGSSDESLPPVPAAVNADASPIPADPSATLLFQTVLADELMPQDENAGSGLVHYSYAATNYPTHWFPYCCSAPLIEYVISGEYSVTPEAPIQVHRSNGDIEEIPANQLVVLNAGDGLVSNIATVVEITNNGEPVELLTWTIISDENFNGRELGNWIENSFDGFGVPDPPTPGLVSLWNLTLQPGEVWTPPPGSVVYRVTMPANDEGTPTPPESTTKSDDGVITNISASVLDVFVLTLEQASEATPSP